MTQDKKVKHEVKVSVVIPAYNEEQGIEEVLDELQETLPSIGLTYEIIVVDDGSEDRTADIVKERKVILVQHPYNKGYGVALKTGIKKAKGEWILITDADGSYPIKDVPKLLEQIDKYDMVVGARIGKNVKIPLFRKPGKIVLSVLANYLSGTKIPDLNSGLRVFKKEIALRFFNLFPSGFSFTTTITLAFLSNECSIKYVPTNYHKRKGTSKINPIKDGINFALLIIRTITYFNPVRVFLPISFLLGITGLIILSYNIIIYRNITDLSIILILISLQIGFFGLLADIIVRRR